MQNAVMPPTGPLFSGVEGELQQVFRVFSIVPLHWGQTCFELFLQGTSGLPVGTSGLHVRPSSSPR